MCALVKDGGHAGSAHARVLEGSSEAVPGKMGSFTPGSLFASLAVSAVGFGLTSYGKKAARLPHLIVGLVMLVYPFFVPKVVPMLIVAGALLAALWVARWRGL